MITRRTLVASALAQTALPSEPEVRLGRKLRLAIIGFDGHPGEITGQLERLPEVETVAIADPDPKVLARESRKSKLAHAKQYADYREMLDREKLDLVAVCNNNGERGDAVLATVSHGLDTIAEKPLAISRPLYTKIRKEVEHRKVKLGMLLPMRFSPPFLALRKIVKDGLVGEVAQIGAQKSYKAGNRAAWFKKRETYGSTILWIGVHMFDLMRWTSGREFTEVAGIQGHVAFPELGDMENVTASLFKMDNGGAATLRMDYLRSGLAETHGDDRLRLAGTEGIAEYQAETGVTLMTRARKPHRITDLPPRGSVFIDFLESSYAGKPAALPLSDIWQVNEITLAAHEASVLNRIIRIPPPR